MNEQWQRQRRELDAYNLFFAAIKGEITGEGFQDLGYRYVGRFLTISDTRNGVEAHPDFVLWNGRTMLLVEVKSGTNINDRAIRQMKQCGNVSIEAGQEFLEDTDPISELDPNDLRVIQPCIVYYDEVIEECKEHDSCVAALDELKQHALVITQAKGAKLRLEDGLVEDAALEEKLDRGFQLPEAPAKHVYLTEEIEIESLVFSICFDIVVNNLGNGRFELTPQGVREHYLNRAIPMDRVDRAFRFLEEIGACEQTDGGGFEFSVQRIGAINEVPTLLSEQSVVDWLEDGDEDQASLDEFS